MLSKEQLIEKERRRRAHEIRASKLGADETLADDEPEIEHEWFKKEYIKGD